LALFPDSEEHSFDRRLHGLLVEKRKLSQEMLLPPAPTNADMERLYSETMMN